MIPDEALILLDKLPPEVAGYGALAVLVLVLVLWLIGRVVKWVSSVYGTAAKSKDGLLDRYETRLKQVEASLANITQEYHAKSEELSGALRKVNDLREKLEAAKDDRDTCEERMRELEERYEKRIGELEREIDKLRSELSEPMPFSQV